jgi:phage terminase large subunit-like protein
LQALAIGGWRRRCGLGGLFGKDEATGARIIFNIKRKHCSSHAAEKLVRQTAEADGYDTEIIIEQEPGSSGKALADHFVRNVLPDFRVRIVPATTKKMARAQPTIRRLGC